MPATTIAEPMNARSRRTRAALLAAARSILEEDGFEALTMTTVAERAGITRRAAYLHFASRADLVRALFDFVAETEGLEDSLREVWDASSGTEMLERWAAHLARYHPRLLAVDRAMERVWRSDPDAAAHRRRVIGEQMRNCRRIVAKLEEEGRLAPGWTPSAAADMLYALISSEVVEALLVDRRWSKRQFTAQLSLLLRSTFAEDRQASER